MMSTRVFCAPPMSGAPTSEYEAELLVLSMRDVAEKLCKEISYSIGVDPATNTPVYLARENFRQEFDVFRRPRRFPYLKDSV